MKDSTIKNMRKALAYARHFATHFYSISASEYSITLQGKLNPDLLVKLSSMRFTYELAPNGFLMYKRGNITIVLT